MISKSVAFLLADLGVTKTHSRPHPHVSNDKPFSDAQFKTLKYRPAFPERFGSIQDARANCHAFFLCYNTEHHHSGLGLLTPADVHHGRAEQRVAARAAVLATAYAAHPERFPAGLPHLPGRSVEVCINPPKTRAIEQTGGFAPARGGVQARGGVLDHASLGRLVSAHRSDLRRPGLLEAPA
jgi:putative transposase